MKIIIVNLEGEDVTENDDGTIRFKSKAAIDSDGLGPHYGDRTAQNETSLKLNGKSLNADDDKYIVVPPIIIRSVKGVVLGCQAYLWNTINDKRTAAVVGDIGPMKKLGEISRATAIALGINPSPVSGGVDAHRIVYLLQPGTPAIVDGKEYILQPS